MPSELRFADLFAGIGGFHAALSGSAVLKGACVYASEIDDACREVYERTFDMQPDGDIWPVTRNAGLVPDHDMLCAGFPCQPFSKSGQQRGIDEARGTLFEAILRVLNAKRPRYVLLENVPNLVGLRHRGTWTTIIRLLRDHGYAVSDRPTLLSPHRLPLEFGAPQVRQRVFIPGVYVGRSCAATLAPTLPPLLEESPFPDWEPDRWDVVAYLEQHRWVHEELSTYVISDEKARAIDMWNDFIDQLDERIPRFPLWTDVLLGDLVVGPDNPPWKNGLIAKNAVFFERHGDWVNRWARRWALAGQLPSYRKLEWQAQEGQRNIWAHAIQFRPSGIRVRPLTYLPALVAINQTSIIGPQRRTITPHEAGLLQGFRHDSCGRHTFAQHPEPGTAFRQFGNAVHVGTTRLVAESLVLGIEGSGPVPVPDEWRAVREHVNSAPRTPSEIVRDDEFLPS